MLSPPNLLIVMTDQEQADLTDPVHPCQTPNADRLSAEGLRFRNAYCPTAHCCPSRASFMTGLYPSRHGVYNNVCTPTAINVGLNPGVTTFSDLLSSAGYRLGYAGKWHVSGLEDPADRGWEELLVRARARDVMQPAIDSWRVAACSRTYTPQTAHRPQGCIRRPGWGDFTLFGAESAGGAFADAASQDRAVVEAAVTAMRRYARESAPWCVFVGLDGPHDPYVVPDHFLDRYDVHSVSLPRSHGDDLADRPGIYRRMRNQLWSQMSDEETRNAVRHYWARATLQDSLLGELLDALDATGDADNTLVVRISDHGDYAGAHGLFLKGVPAFREAYHIPSIVRWPAGIIRPGRVVDQFVTLADFAPTFLELARVSPPVGLTGRSLRSFFRDEPVPDWPQEVYSQFNGVELYYTQRAVVTRHLKYVFNGFDMDELYDLAADPDEMVNVSERPEYRDAKHDLVERLWRFAARENDELIFNDYGTVALLPWGPSQALTG